MTVNVEGVSADLSALRRDIVQLTETLRELLEQQTRTAGARATDAAEGVREKVAQAAGDAQKSALAAGDDIVAGIERNPLAAILIALGLGLIIGLIGRPRG